MDDRLRRTIQTGAPVVVASAGAAISALSEIGGTVMTWWVAPIMLAAGCVTPLPYNYRRMKVFGRACR